MIAALVREIVESGGTLTIGLNRDNLSVIAAWPDNQNPEELRRNGIRVLLSEFKEDTLQSVLANIVQWRKEDQRLK